MFIVYEPHIYVTKLNSREEEGIELQVFSGKQVSDSPPNAGSVTSYGEIGAVAGTDADSIDSGEYQQQIEQATDLKTNGTIDLKADVHRKNSSESSEEVSIRPVIEIVTPYRSEICTLNELEVSKKVADHRGKKRDRPQAEGFVAISITDDTKVPNCRSSFRKLSRQASTDSQDSSLVTDHRPSLQSVESGTISATSYGLMMSCGRRHSNVTNSSLSFLPSVTQSNIKPTGSLELGYIDKNPNQTLTLENYNYFKNNRNGVRRIRSTALETCCPAPSNLEVHPNSLEIICSGHNTIKNPVLPPPSSSLIRNQHFSLCPHFTYGSEIVYPIAEQSDEHQTSHGPDTDIESLRHNSDSDYEENNTGSRSPLLVRLENVDCVKLVHAVPNDENVEKELRKANKSKENYNSTISASFNSAAKQKQLDSDENVERTSATSKEALLENDNSNSNSNSNTNSNSSATPEMQDAQVDCYATDNEFSDHNKKYSECSFCTDSNTSLDREENVIEKGDMSRSSTVKLKPLLVDKNAMLTNCQDSENKIIRDREDGVINRRTGKRSRQKKINDSAKNIDEAGNCSSLMGLDWLFDHRETDTHQRGNTSI